MSPEPAEESRGATCCELRTVETRVLRILAGVMGDGALFPLISWSGIAACFFGRRPFPFAFILQAFFQTIFKWPKKENLYNTPGAWIWIFVYRFVNTWIYLQFFFLKAVLHGLAFFSFCCNKKKGTVMKCLTNLFKLQDRIWTQVEIKLLNFEFFISIVISWPILKKKNGKSSRSCQVVVQEREESVERTPEFPTH